MKASNFPFCNFGDFHSGQLNNIVSDHTFFFVRVGSTEIQLIFLTSTTSDDMSYHINHHSINFKLQKLRIRDNFTSKVTSISTLTSNF
jgi:hypothetical protein